MCSRFVLSRFARGRGSTSEWSRVLALLERFGKTFSALAGGLVSSEGPMSSTNGRFIVAYILLVGLPLAGLAGVLRAGRHLKAPIAIDGTWKIETTAKVAATQPCDQAIASLLTSSLVVSQSGQTLELTLNGVSRTTVAGELDGSNLKASIGSRTGCPADQPVTLVASVDPKTEPKSLTGSFSVANCASCSPLEFRAARQPRAPSGGGH
jgi:hypothetical protein